MADYDAPVAVRELEKMMNDFTYNNGLQINHVFDDFLTYVIHYFTPNAKPLEDWKYKKEETAVFWGMFQEWIKIMDKQLISKEWYDAFGELYMACVAGRSKQQYTGQFFTPAHICDLMTDINGSEKVVGKRINDPACGSGYFQRD